MHMCRVIQELDQKRQHTIFSAAHLRKLVAEGRWGEAISYVRTFYQLRDVEALALVFYLLALESLANTAGATDSQEASDLPHRLEVVLLTSISRRAELSSYATTVTVLNSPLYRYVVVRAMNSCCNFNN